MNCPETLRAQAYFDGEVDALVASNIERHIDLCGSCRSLLEDLGAARSSLRRLPVVGAPPALRARIANLLDAEAGVAGRVAARAPDPRAAIAPAARGAAAAPGRSFWQGAFSGMVGTALAAGLAFVLMVPPRGTPLLDDLVAAHVRSLMPEHLLDVVSTDQHTVKPWFAGHVDVSPVVADFTAQGYPLVGGRADYLEHQRAAVVVYRHGPHVINVFSWVDAGRGAAAPRASQETTRSGYRLAFWREADVEYCAISDTGWEELHALVRLLQQAS